jgi:uncharacterized protein
MIHLFIQLVQSVTGAVIFIVLLLLVAAIIGYLTAWFYAKSIYKPIIKGLEDDKARLNKEVDNLKERNAELNKKVSGLEDDINKLNDKIGMLNEKMAKLEASHSEINIGSFVAGKAKNGEDYFRLKSADGKTLLRSEMYTTKAACNNGIESVRKNCQNDKRYERKISSNNKHYFNLKANNGQVIGTSDMFDSAEEMENIIQAVKINGITTTLEENID